MSQSTQGTVQVTLSEVEVESEDVDGPDAVEQAREEALEGGARYRQIARDQSEGTPAIDQYCTDCGGHVSRKYVKVNGVDGQIHACPDCSDTSERLNGAAAGRERRGTL